VFCYAGPARGDRTPGARLAGGMPPRAVFSPGSARNLASSRTASDGGGPLVMKESDVLESEFSKWKVALDNKIKADDLRSEIEEKKSFKAMQLAQKKERQEKIQATVREQRLAAKSKIEAIKEANLEKGAAIKDHAGKMRQAAQKEKTAYAEAGYELTRLHGPEQAKRTASRYVELARQKASYGQGGKEDRMALATQRIQQRTARLEEKRQLVEKMKGDEDTIPSEAKKFALGQKKALADGIRTQQKEWKETKTTQTTDFLALAKTHHGKIEATKHKAKHVRQELQTMHQKVAAKERDAAKQHEASMLDGDNSRAAQIKLNHDLLLAKKYTAEANAELVKQPLAAAVAKMRAKSPSGDEEGQGSGRQNF